jgi:hypothetical protein
MHTILYLSPPDKRELRLEYSPISPLLLAQWAKDNLLVPQLPPGDPRRERLLSVRLLDLDALTPPFDPVPSCSADIKAQHDGCRWVLIVQDTTERRLMGPTTPSQM